jgi:gas vesicle protein
MLTLVANPPSTFKTIPYVLHFLFQPAFLRLLEGWDEKRIFGKEKYAHIADNHKLTSDSIVNPDDNNSSNDNSSRVNGSSSNVSTKISASKSQVYVPTSTVASNPAPINTVSVSISTLHP